MPIEWVIILLYGVFMGNFATSAIFRLPRNIPIFGIKRDDGVPPHCSACKHPLRMWEYFPIIGWIICRGKCSYCKIKIPYDYFMAEIAVTLFSVMFFLKFGLNETYLIAVLVAMSLVTLAIIEIRHKQLPIQALFALGITGVIFRLLEHNELFPVMLTAMIAWILGIGLTRNIAESNRRLTLLGLFMAVGITLDFSSWIVAIVTALIFAIIFRLSTKSFQIALAVITGTLFALI